MEITMKTSHLIAAALAVLFSSLPVAAQSVPAPPVTAASAPQADCAKAFKRHDHGAERNAPSPQAMPCRAEAGASSADAGAKKPAPHDHAKFHKNQ
jgi:hypothetical protein